MKLICGLGNPGNEYSYSRHNIGYLVVDSLLHQFSLKLKAGKGDFLYARTTIPDGDAKQEVVFTRPTLQMNLSGVPVSQMMEQLGSHLDELLLVLDDVGGHRVKPPLSVDGTAIRSVSWAVLRSAVRGCSTPL